MSPVPPKPATQRRNRNRKLAGEWVVLDEVYSGPIPQLPETLEWSDETQSWWTRIWNSLMATQWLEADAEALSLLALVRQRFLEGDMRLAQEVRLGSDAFGLTPKGRQRLRWSVTEKDAERAGLVGNEVANLREQRAKRLSE